MVNITLSFLAPALSSLVILSVVTPVFSSEQTAYLLSSRGREEALAPASEETVSIPLPPFGESSISDGSFFLPPRHTGLHIPQLRLSAKHRPFRPVFLSPRSPLGSAGAPYSPALTALVRSFVALILRMTNKRSSVSISPSLHAPALSSFVILSKAKDLNCRTSFPCHTEIRKAPSRLKAGGGRSM